MCWSMKKIRCGRIFEVDLAKTDNGKYVDRRIQKALEMMLADGKKEGLPLMVCSAYRDYQKQDQLMDNSIAKFVRGGMSYKDAFFQDEGRNRPHRCERASHRSRRGYRRKKSSGPG